MEVLFIPMHILPFQFFPGSAEADIG